jgi:hypothetical protein
MRDFQPPVFRAIDSKLAIKPRGRLSSRPRSPVMLDLPTVVMSILTFWIWPRGATWLYESQGRRQERSLVDS